MTQDHDLLEGPVQVVFDRIGRHRIAEPLLVLDAQDADDLAERIFAYARGYLLSRDVTVNVDLAEGRGNIVCGFNSGGTFTIQAAAERPADADELGEEDRRNRLKKVFSHGGEPGGDARLNILAEKCATCIFRPGNPMHLGPGRVRDMVAACVRNQTHIICHDTLQDGVDGAICRGFYDAHGGVSQLVRVAERMRAIRFVAPPTRNEAQS